MARALLAAAALLLAVSLALPLWVTRMEAPQYRDEEILEVAVYAGWVVGDIDEIEILNQYVGVHLPLDTPELAAAPWVLGALLALSLVALALRPAARRRATVALCVAMALVIVGGATLLQYRLYQMGHERSPQIMRGVPDFTPPLLGAKKIANFTAYMSLGSGAWTYLGALALAVWSARRRPTTARGASRASSGTREAGPGEAAPAEPRPPSDSGMARVRVAAGGRT